MINWAVSVAIRGQSIHSVTFEPIVASNKKKYILNFFFFILHFIRYDLSILKINVEFKCSACEIISKTFYSF